jgi:hypothetical protein
MAGNHPDDLSNKPSLQVEKTTMHANDMPAVRKKEKKRRGDKVHEGVVMYQTISSSFICTYPNEERLQSDSKQENMNNGMSNIN